jgi:hypothetical protein
MHQNGAVCRSAISMLEREHAILGSIASTFNDAASKGGAFLAGMVSARIPVSFVAYPATPQI